MAVESLFADWPAPDNIIAGTTLRTGGASSGVYTGLNLGGHVGDDEDAVRQNRQSFRAALQLPDEPRWLRQTHSTRVASEHPAEGQECDALVSREPDAVCVVLTADCLPVLFVDRNGSEIGAAHAGWRGLCGGILEATVATMQSSASSLLAWLGPAISQSAFEVGGEVREQFMEHDAQAAAAFVENARGRYQADLYELARQRLASVGVTQVFGGAECTYNDPVRYYSYRRDGQCGRMASFIFRRREDRETA